jgi:hypothetical protein
MSTLQVRLEVRRELCGVHRPAERPVEGFPLDGRFHACRVGVHPGTPSGQPAPLIDDGDILSVDRSRDNPHHV